MKLPELEFQELKTVSLHLKLSNQDLIAFIIEKDVQIYVTATINVMCLRDYFNRLLTARRRVVLDPKRVKSILENPLKPKKLDLRSPLLWVKFLDLDIKYPPRDKFDYLYRRAFQTFDHEHLRDRDLLDFKLTDVVTVDGIFKYGKVHRNQLNRIITGLKKKKRDDSHRYSVFRKKHQRIFKTKYLEDSEFPKMTREKQAIIIRDAATKLFGKSLKPSTIEKKLSDWQKELGNLKNNKDSRSFKSAH